jgi:hypothetical protein
MRYSFNLIIMHPLRVFVLVFVLFVIATSLILMPLYEHLVAPAILVEQDLLPTLIIIAFVITGVCILYYRFTRRRKSN